MRSRRLTQRFVICLLLASMASLRCSGGPENSPAPYYSPQFPTHAPVRREPEPGFFERLADRFTERECNVGRFTCPYGLGRAGEPCECVDGRGYVRRGQTVK
jgi:hypothetical protein